MRPLSLALSIVQNRVGAVPRPSWCTYIATYRCNARCGMCDSWRMRPGEELSAEQVRLVFARIGRLDVVRLTGGEPFLRPDMVELAEAVLTASRPFVIHVTTNGSFPDRIADFVERFSRPRMLRFMVSFDGLAAEHDASRGKHVTFDLAMESVRRLVELRHRFGVEVSANHTVISAQSLADHDGLRAMLAELGVDVHSVLAYSESAIYGAGLRGKRADHVILRQGYPLHPNLAGADVIGFVERELTRLGDMGSSALRWGKRYYLRGLYERLRGADHPRPKPRCVAVRSHIRLLPDGSVPVCQFNSQTVGNLLRQSFDDVWSGDPASQAREWVDQCVGCWAECEVMPSAIYTGDIVRA
jgi:MoaA/NifB/PqqE/SkfB family radical SAM enzyme